MGFSKMNNDHSSYGDPLNFSSIELPGQSWFSINGTWATLNDGGQLMDRHGFLIDDNGRQLTDSDGNYIKVKDREVKK